MCRAYNEVCTSSHFLLVQRMLQKLTKFSMLQTVLQQTLNICKADITLYTGKNYLLLFIK